MRRPCSLMEGCDLSGGKLEQLDFNAPLISTRRLGGLSGGDNNGHQKTQEAAVPSPGDACTSVPFLWEAVPGVPKAAEREHDRDEAAELPRPPPPPGRWRPSGDDGGGGGGGWDSDTGRRGGPDDSGHEGDVDIGSGGHHEDFSTSADLASPTDSLSVACSLDQADGVLDAVCVEEGGELSRSSLPGFMMRRFLSAAAAVATSFPSDVPQKPPRRAYHAPRHHRYYHPREKMTIEAGLQLDFARRSQSTRSCSSSKACGITVFFPWGFKQAFCGVKSSVQSRASFDRRSHGSSRPGPAQNDAPRHSFRSEANADGGAAAEARRARTWDTPGWGMRFLDCRGCEGVAVAERGSEGKGSRKDHGRTTWSLPLLRSPSEPWLAQALRTINKGT